MKVLFEFEKIILEFHQHRKRHKTQEMMLKVAFKKMMNRMYRIIYKCLCSIHSNLNVEQYIRHFDVLILVCYYEKILKVVFTKNDLELNVVLIAI